MHLCGIFAPLSVLHHVSRASTVFPQLFFDYFIRYAVSYQLQGPRIEDKDCALKYYCDDECYNMYSHIVIWMVFTPAFQLSIELISSPLALLVALWGMTSNVTLRMMLRYGREETSTPQKSLLPR